MKAKLKEDISILNGTIYTPTKVFRNCNLQIKSGKVAAVGSSKNLKLIKEGIEIDAEGLYVLPGFIDSHLHGGGGSDTLDGTVQSIYDIAQAHAKHGVTSIVPAIPPAQDEVLRKSMKAVKDASLNTKGGARILGFHFESPFTSLKHSGAIDKRFLSAPSLERALQFWKNSEGAVKIVTLAPELPGILPIIDFFVKHKISVSMGHSDASYQHAIEAISHGANRVTHIFNSMKGLHHRDPGIPGVALASNKVFVELIADGYHVHPSVINLVLKAAGYQRTILMTDAISVVGTEKTSFTIPPGIKVQIRNGRTWDPNGNLVGSVLTLDRAIRNICNWFDVPLEQVVPLATKNVAQSLGITSKGMIEVGKDADIVILDDQMNVKMTIVEGEIVYRNM